MLLPLSSLQGYLVRPTSAHPPITSFLTQNTPQISINPPASYPHYCRPQGPLVGAAQALADLGGSDRCNPLRVPSHLTSFACRSNSEALPPRAAAKGQKFEFRRRAPPPTIRIFEFRRTPPPTVRIFEFRRRSPPPTVGFVKPMVTPGTPVQLPVPFPALRLPPAVLHPRPTLHHPVRRTLPVRPLNGQNLESIG